jgi:hypothetical protein
MHAKGGAQADEGQQSSGPTAVETRQQRQAPDQMGRYRDPHHDTGRGHVHGGKKFRGADRITQLEDAVPHEQARHQQSGQRRQKDFAAHELAPFKNASNEQG